MKNRFFVYSLFIFTLLSLSSCKSTDVQKREYSVQSVMWQQNAAEYRALCYQAFNTAKLNLDQFMANAEKSDKTPAIITDIDETVFDNSFYNAKLIELNEEFTPEEWARWSELEEAEAVPGAKEFLNYAKEKGVEIFYITNRHVDEEEGTIRNMEKLNFPFADKEHLLLMSDTGSKKDRFAKVEENHHVFMYMGDNLSDFTSKFRAPSTKERNDLADELRHEFGVKFIVLPNPMYGDWETKGIYEGKSDWTDQQKDSIRKAAIRAY